MAALRDRELPEEAERWLRAAAEDGGEQWVEPLDPAKIDAGLGPRHQACLDLVALLTAQGRLDEATQWRDRAKRILNWESNVNRSFFRRAGTGTVVVTAVVATAVIPFVQALISKAAEDAYGQARALVQRMLRRSSPQHEAGNGATLLITDDPDAHITLCLWSDVTDEALRALASLDLDELTAQRPDRGRIWSGTRPIQGGRSAATSEISKGSPAVRRAIGATMRRSQAVPSPHGPHVVGALPIEANQHSAALAAQASAALAAEARLHRGEGHR
ncbi:hypothetical protein [Streptomyces sp. NPDC001450]